MRTTIALAWFLGLVGSTTVGHAAPLERPSTETLVSLTEDVLDACPEDAYGGAGRALVAPMSRTLLQKRCDLDATDAAAPGPQSGPTGGLSIIAASDSMGSCANGAGDCSQSASAIATNLTITDGGTSYTFGAGAIGAANAWRDVLRIVFAGMEQDDGSDIALRDCNGAVRRLTVDNWCDLFESGCTTGACTQLRHAFRREDHAGTTEVFVSLLGLPTSVFAPANLQRSPFCNAKTASTVAAEGPAPNAPPYHMEFQDNDPIRRTCLGAFNLPLTPGSEPVPDCQTPFSPSMPGKCAVYSGTEQVCNKDGTLGIVLPINPPPATSPTSINPYSLTNPASSSSPVKICSRGKFIFGNAPGKASGGTPTGTFDYCPNGDTPFFVNKCLIPAATDDDSNCVNGKNNLPAFEFTPPLANATDGRVYNLTLRNSAAGTIATIKRPNPNTVGGPLVDAPIIGAFYRLHVSRSGEPFSHVGASSSPVPAGVFANCRDGEPTSQIGCLVTRSPCSIGYVGLEAGSTAESVTLERAAAE